MGKNLELYRINYQVHAASLTETLALLSEIHQRTGFNPETIATPNGTTLTWDAKLALKVATYKASEDDYTTRCAIS